MKNNGVCIAAPGLSWVFLLWRGTEKLYTQKNKKIYKLHEVTGVEEDRRYDILIPPVTFVGREFSFDVDTVSLF